MPRKFRNRFFVHIDSYVITEHIPEGKKVNGEIIRILLANQIKYFKSQNIWPQNFDTRSNTDKMWEKNTVSDRGSVHGKKMLLTLTSGQGEQIVCSTSKK